MTCHLKLPLTLFGAFLAASLCIQGCSGRELVETEQEGPVKSLVIEDETIQPKPTVAKPEPKKIHVTVPSHPTPLDVEGFAPASHVGPDNMTSEPRPVTVILHGNFDRPEWQCEMWKQAAGFYGWVLCPRGVRTNMATLEEDRWTYRGPGIVQKEIDAGLEALHKKYPGLVSDDGTVLVGFSLGGNYAPGLATKKPWKYKYLFLVEGGEKKIDGPTIRALKRAGVRAIGLAMSVGSRRRTSKKIISLLNKFDFKNVYVDMKGAGHNYRQDFSETGKNALKQLVAVD